MFVLASNHFRKSFYTSSCVWLRMKNRIFQKSISFDCKIKALTQKLFYILFSLQTISRLRHAERERRESRELSTSRNQTHWWDCTTWSLSLLDRSRPPLGQIISSFGSISSSATRWSISSFRSILSLICFLSLISDFIVVVVVVVWVMVFWWFLCCVVVGFVWIVVDFLWVLVCGWWWIFCGVLMCGWWWILWYKICLEVEKMWKIL